ncbi:DUF2938 domain-containing protein [Cupriavidus basilensis]|uniref:DUF2938 domain-containing protein n=1 Tax=Cupriavidus basilensis TaxID=68895 RepID=A0ABT6AYM1_9BURK|nr:DUF2938 domain-containing protein [Cupriavidus basilensis]MDF3837722.1 DUF2938 domain-containing protein [Cupriavidus basilensis]
MISMGELIRLVLIGVGATAVMDVWSMIQKSLGIPTLDYAMVGRWAGHLCRGRFAHASIGKAAPIPGELSLGWAIHYAVGIAFAVLLVGIYGAEWLHDPVWLPALAVGTVTVVIPFFVMQPAMGAGIAASRTPTPWKNRLRSLLTHAIFGGGLYLSAAVLKLVWE